MPRGKILVTGPYVGELGWELFSWQPLVRNQFKTGDAVKCFVYTGPGREDLYRFATVRTLKDMPQHESECLAWRNIASLQKELQALMNQMMEEVKQEAPLQGHDIQMFSYNSLPALNQPFYERGWPDLLKGDPAKFEALAGAPRLLDGTVVLCVRDRKMSDFRNWDYSSWYNLAAALLEADVPVAVLGQIQNPDEWELPDGCLDFTNKTTINDCLAVMSAKPALAVGASTGLLHLASRAGVPHLVWGTGKNVMRYAETNWFATPHKVLPIGWAPEPELVADAVLDFIKKGTFE